MTPSAARADGRSASLGARLASWLMSLRKAPKQEKRLTHEEKALERWIDDGGAVGSPPDEEQGRASR